MALARIKAPVETAALYLADSTVKASHTFVDAANSDLSITVKNGIATLAGKTDTAAESNMVEYLVSRMNGVEKVINLICHDC